MMMWWLPRESREHVAPRQLPGRRTSTFHDIASDGGGEGRTSRVLEFRSAIVRLASAEKLHVWAEDRFISAINHSNSWMKFCAGLMLRREVRPKSKVGNLPLLMG